MSGRSCPRLQHPAQLLGGTPTGQPHFFHLWLLGIGSSVTNPGRGSNDCPERWGLPWAVCDDVRPTFQSPSQRWNDMLIDINAAVVSRCDCVAGLPSEVHFFHFRTGNW